MGYSTLITEIAEELNRTDQNVRIGKSINQVIRNLERKHDFNYMITKDASPITLTAGSYLVDFPTNYKKIIWLRYLDGTDYTPIIQESEENCLNAYPSLTNDTGEPLVFASRWEESKFLIRPTADVNYSIYRKYFKKSVDLSVGNETNWLTENAPEILFYGALLEMSAFVRDTEAVQYWQAKHREVFFDQIKVEIAEVDSYGLSTIEGAYRA